LSALASCAPTPDDVNDHAAVEPVFPENYRATFTEVRDCRLGIEHDGYSVRVLANEIARDGYLNNLRPLPVGSIVIKEEYDAADCADDAVLVQWRAMRKESPGFDPGDGDWHWQRVLSDRRVVEDAKASCIGCHRDPDCTARDYMCMEP
jgi:hypothetical protein